jgi:hypothetical protein
VGLGIKVDLITCGTCGRRYFNPLTHSCVSRMTRPPRRSSLKVSVTRTCGRCGKPAPNPFSHRCATRSDWRKRVARDKRQKEAARKKRARAAAAAKRKAARASRPARPPHDYRACYEADCPRRVCIAYRDGITDCPLPHEAS